MYTAFIPAKNLGKEIKFNCLKFVCPQTQSEMPPHLTITSQVKVLTPEKNSLSHKMCNTFHIQACLLLFKLCCNTEY